MRFLLLALSLMFLGGCATITAASATSEPGWFIADRAVGTHDILYCYPPHYKQSKYAGKCFTIN
jgi:hypothetical protein